MATLILEGGADPNSVDFGRAGRNLICDETADQGRWGLCWAELRESTVENTSVDGPFGCQILGALGSAERRCVTTFVAFIDLACSSWMTLEYFIDSAWLSCLRFEDAPLRASAFDHEAEYWILSAHIVVTSILTSKEKHSDRPKSRSTECRWSLWKIRCQILTTCRHQDDSMQPRDWILSPSGPSGPELLGEGSPCQGWDADVSPNDGIWISWGILWNF